MRILVDCCNYFLDNNNNGDRAVYKVLEMHLRHFWPDAEISWVTLDPGLIQQTISGVIPFTLGQRHDWQLFTSIQKAKAPGVLGLVSKWGGRSFPDKVQQTLLNTMPDVNIFIDTVKDADLVIALGGGALSDHFPGHARGLLDTLEGGLVFEKPVALLSAGFERISNQSLIKKYERVLPRLQLITCREPNIGPAMLSSLGVSNKQVCITGDQAVELAYQLRPDQPGLAIGINLRQSSYSEIDEKPIEIIRAVVQAAGYRYSASLLGAPISIFGPSDVESIKKITAGYRGFVDAGEKLDRPELVIRQIGKCRIVITGSYHSAVFALAQGIPVVGIASSLHYKAKLTGLAVQFSGGCMIVDPTDQDFGNALQDAIDKTWNNATTFREPLLEMARSQIDESWKASRQLFNIVMKSRNA